MIRTLLAGFVLAAVACAHNGTSNEATTPAKAESEVRLEVTNHYSLAADIFAVAQGTKLRLGTVHPGISRTFVLPPSIYGGGLVSIVAEITNENPVFSGSFQLVTGDVLEFEIANHLMASRAQIKGH